MKRFFQNLVLLIGFALCLGAAVALQRAQSARLRAEPEKFRDWLYLPSSEYVQWTTLGYDQLAADFLWLRSIQAFGATMAGAKDQLPQLAAYFDVTTDLDPQFLNVYAFGNLVIGEEAGDHKRGLALLDKGIERNPMKYRLAFEASFFAHWVMDDPHKAKLYAKRALKAPDCPDYVRSWLGYFDKEMGSYQAAYRSYFTDFTRYHNSRDPVLGKIRYLSLRRALNDWTVAELRKVAINWETTHGRQPTMADLENEGLFLDLELPDFVALDAYVKGVEARGEKFPEDAAELERICDSFIRKGWTRLVCPKSDNRHFMGYVVWPNQKPFLPSQGLDKPPENQHYVEAEIDAIAQIIPMITLIEKSAADIKAETGSFPPDESFLPPEVKYFDEPWGGRWVYEKETGRFYPSTHPDYNKQYLEAPRF